MTFTAMRAFTVMTFAGHLLEAMRFLHTCHVGAPFLSALQRRRSRRLGTVRSRGRRHGSCRWRHRRNWRWGQGRHRRSCRPHLLFELLNRSRREVDDPFDVREPVEIALGFANLPGCVEQLAIRFERCIGWHRLRLGRRGNRVECRRSGGSICCSWTRRHTKRAHRSGHRPERSTARASPIDGEAV